MSGGVGSLEAQMEGLLTKWMMLARHNKRVHGAASTYYRKWPDTSMIMSIITGTASSILNIVLGVLDPVNYVVVNLSKILFGLTGLGATVIMMISKQLDLDALGFLHAGYSSKYSKLHRQICAELVLLWMNDSRYASPTEFLKTCAADMKRIEECAPAIPEHVIKRVGAKCTCFLAQSSSRQSEAKHAV
jgi:hypothetical protein